MHMPSKRYIIYNRFDEKAIFKLFFTFDLIISFPPDREKQA